MVSARSVRRLRNVAGAVMWVTGYYLLWLWRRYVPPAVYDVVCIVGITFCLCWFVYAVAAASAEPPDSQRE